MGVEKLVCQDSEFPENLGTRTFIVGGGGALILGNLDSSITSLLVPET
jgi:hypothetical protein